MVAEIKDPTGDTGKEAGGKVPETRRDRTTGTARDLVADEVVTLVVEMEIMAEAEVRAQGGNGKNINPLHQDRHKMWVGGQNCWEGFRSAYRERLIGGVDKKIFART